MDELKSLAEAAGYQVVGSVEQSKPTHPRYHIGSGKAEELAKMARELQAEKIIFGNELKIVQIYNLAKLTGIEVIDRLQLILEIFLKRASTKEAKLQIDLARVQYELANAKEKVRLAKMDEQPGFQGLGKYEVDVYYESVRRRVHSIRHKLKTIKKTRELHRHRRRELGFPSISLAGYTKSGKSTLFNSLTEETVPADSGLFTTLSTTTRMIDLSGEKALLTDTVGFIDKLPLALISAFRSTLEETIFSDLILLVVDISEPKEDVESKISCCLETIREIGATGIPVITVLNKIDLLSKEGLAQAMENLKDASNVVPLSALYKTNLDALRETMAGFVKRNEQSSFTVPANTDSMSLLSWLFDHADVHKVAYDKDKLTVSLGAPPPVLEKIRERVEELTGDFRYE